MVHLPSSLFLLLSVSAAFALPAPAHRRRDINISHTSRSNGTAITHTIDPSTLHPALKAAIEGSDLNINILGDRKRSVAPRSAGITNSTINLTVIGSTEKKLMRKRSSATDKLQRRSKPASSNSTVSATPEPAHHNIHIDASTSGTGTGGGITNSTININLNSRAIRRRKVNLGDNSVLVDTSGGQSPNGAPAGIEDSTVHVNILPARALDKTVGSHSIIIDSSSGNDEGSTTTGTHSAVVDTSSSSNSSSSEGAIGIKGSTINLTVVSPDSDSDSNSTEPAPAARLMRRAESSPAWAAAVKHRSYATTEEQVDSLVVEVEVAAPVEEPLRFEVRRSHASLPSRYSKML